MKQIAPLLPRIHGKNRKMLTAVLWFFLFVFIFMGILGEISSHKNKEQWFYLNQTESLPMGIYIKVPAFIRTLCGRSAFNLQRGDYVVFEPNDETLKLAIGRNYITKDMAFMKKVGGIEGDTWKIDEKYRFYINGEYCGKAFALDRNGEKMPIRIGSFTVAKDEFLPIGEAERSFDGRYTGTVKISNIKAVVKPVFTGLHW